jgi:hypothetical protein
VFEHIEECCKSRAERDAPKPSTGAEFALEHDRSKVAECVTSIKHTLHNYSWLLEGRGSYEWDDDRWHQEFKTATELLQRDLEPLSKIASDWSNCPKKWEDVQAARAAAPASLSTGRLERLRELIDAIRCCARDWLESADRNVVSIAYTTLRAHALVLREDYGPLDGKCTACGRIATAEPPASAKEKQSWNLGLIPRKEGTK